MSEVTVLDPRPAQPARRSSPLDAQPALRGLAVLAWVAALACPLVGETSTPTWAQTSTLLCAVSLTVLAFFASLVKQRSAAPMGASEVFAVFYWLNASVVPLLYAWAPAELPGRQATLQGAESVILIMNGFSTLVLAVSLLPTKPRVVDRQKKSGNVTRIAWLMIVVGLVGVYIRFPTLASVTSYFSGEYDQISLRAEGLEGFVGSILRPFLPAGFLLLWSGRPNALRATLLVLGAVISFGSFALNRAALLIPFAAFAAAYHSHKKRIGSAAVVLFVAGGLALFLAVGSFRTVTLNSQGGKFDVSDPLEQGWGEAASHTVQLYGQTPVRTGLVMDSITSSMVSPKNLGASLASPIPGVEDTVRSLATTRYYNRLIYSRGTTSDQIIPAPLEIAWTMGSGYVVPFAVLIGLILRRFNQLLAGASGVPEATGLFVLAWWIAQCLIVSNTVILQAMIYWGPATMVLIFLARRVR